MDSKREKSKNELKDKIVAKIENTPYTMVSFDYSWEHFGNAVVVLKRGNDQYYMRFICDRSDIYFENQVGKMRDTEWKHIGCITVGDQDRYSLFLNVIEKHAI